MTDTSRRWVTLARVGAWGAGVVTAAVVLLVFVFPTRTYLDQRRQLAQTATELHALDQQNATLSADAAKLRTTAEIERLAREQYHLVRPGERAFAILPPPVSIATATPPSSRKRDPGGLWRALTSWVP